MTPLSKRLSRVMREGALTKRDLQIWFGRPYQTVRVWIVGQASPWEPWRDDVERKLVALERLVARRKDLPVPASYSPSDRSELIRRLVHERDARLSQSHSAGG